MRPHFWRIMSWTTTRDSAIGALVWTATKSFHCSGVTSQNLIECCRLSLRIVAWPTPALLTRMSIVPKRPRALETISSIDSSQARSASIVMRLALCCRSCAARARSARPCEVRSTAAILSPLPSSPSTSSRPMPPAAPVTIATRCCSLIVFLLSFRVIANSPAAGVVLGSLLVGRLGSAGGGDDVSRPHESTRGPGYHAAKCAARARYGLEHCCLNIQRGRPWPNTPENEGADQTGRGGRFGPHSLTDACLEFRSGVLGGGRRGASVRVVSFEGAEWVSSRQALL